MFLPMRQFLKIYLDDERPAPEGWILVATPADAIDYLKTGKVLSLSLDHDLGDDVSIGTGYDVLSWIEERVVLYGFVPPIIDIHTANPSARIKMSLALDTIKRYRRKYFH